MMAVWLATFSVGIGILACFGRLRRSENPHHVPAHRIIALTAIGTASTALALMWTPMPEQLMQFGVTGAPSPLSVVFGWAAVIGLASGVLAFVAAAPDGLVVHHTAAATGLLESQWTETVERLALCIDRARSVEQLAGDALSVLGARWGGDAGACWVYDSEQGRLALQASFGLDGGAQDSVRRLDARGSIFAQLTGMPWPHRVSREAFAWNLWRGGRGEGDVIILPLVSSERCTGFLLFDGVSDAVEPASESRHGSVVAVQLGGAIRGLTEATRHGVDDHKDRAVAAIRARLGAVADLESATTALGEVLVGEVPVEFISLSAIDGSGRYENRISMMVNGPRILERRRNMPIVDPISRRALSTGRTVHLVESGPDRTATGAEESSSFVLPIRGMRSRMSTPIIGGDRALGTVTFAHTAPDCYDADASRLTEAVAHELVPFVERLRNREREEHRQRLMVKLSELTRARSADAALDILLGAVDVGEIALARADVSFDNMRVVARARVNRPTGVRIADGERIALSRLPWQRLAMSAQRPFRIDQNDPESVVGDEETRLILQAGFKTGVILPIVHGEMSVGTLTAFEYREPARSRLGSADVLFLRVAADVLARFLVGEGERLSTMVGDGQSDAKTESRRLRAFSDELLDPLTTIAAGAELLRLNKREWSPETLTSLKRIERAGQSIQQSIDRHLRSGPATAVTGGLEGRRGMGQSDEIVADTLS